MPGAPPGHARQQDGQRWRRLADEPRTQIRWGLHYIKVVYRYPYTAWRHELR